MRGLTPTLQISQAVTGSDTGYVMVLYIACSISFEVGMYRFIK
jgi:hypothetical protein